MTIIALELLPPPIEGGLLLAQEESKRVRSLLTGSGLLERINTLLVPQIIPEDGDRPVPMKERLDPLDTSQALAQELSVGFIFTQVTPFTPVKELQARVARLREAGAEHVVFVGVPRVLGDRPVVGPTPGDAVHLFRDLVPSRGVILIPTRVDEETRFRGKLESGANFALTQLLFSDSIVPFLISLSKHVHRPEILLSFGYVPNVELKVGLLKWLIRDDVPAVHQEMEHIDRLASLPFNEKKARFVELYKRVLDGLGGLDFPLGLHLECPYGVSEPALETFNAMLEVWPGD